MRETSIPEWHDRQHARSRRSPPSRQTPSQQSANSTTLASTTSHSPKLRQRVRDIGFHRSRRGQRSRLVEFRIRTMRDTLSVTRTPVVFSHLDAYSVQQYLRHVPDDVLRGVKRSGGIVMVTFVNRFLHMQDPVSASIGDVVDHVFRVAEIVGWEPVGV
ncbi:hypothetical protein BBP40_008846 [Aspergillus hancockii]|nr:hypothetical protein BBP40_008846 [Aspergillus hancockii]